MWLVLDVINIHILMTHNDANSATNTTYLQMIKIDIDIPKLQYVEQLFIIFTIVFMMIYNCKAVSICDFFRTWNGKIKDIFLKMILRSYS